MYYACDNILYFFHYHHFHSSFITSFTLKKYHLYQVHQHQHARGGSLGGAMHDLYGESTNKTSGRAWIALYVNKQLKVFFNIPRFTIAYENIIIIFFFQVHSIDLVDHYSWFLFCLTFMEQQRGRGVKVQNWPHIILKNNARHRIKTIY